MNEQINVETQAQLLRHALSLALWHAQDLGWERECDRALTVIRDVDTRRLYLEGFRRG